MDLGELVSDDIMIAMVRTELEKMNEVRILLDGFPRTTVQAEALDNLLQSMNLEINSAIFLEVNDEELIQRLFERARAEGRDDDNEETVQKRMKVYQNQTKPIFEFYKDKGKLLQVNGMGTINEVAQRIQGALA